METTIAELLKAALAERGAPGKPWSYRAAARHLDGSAAAVSDETLRRIANGDSRAPDDVTIEALVALGVDRAQLLDALGLAHPENAGPFSLPPRADRLTRAQRTIVLTIVDAFLASNDASQGN